MINATKTDAADTVLAHVETAIRRLEREDRQLAHILTHSVAIAERPTNAKERRGHAIGRVFYTWIRREEEDREAVARDIETLASLGRTDRWQAAVRTWAHVARTDPGMFAQYSTYANFAAE